MADFTDLDHIIYRAARDEADQFVLDKSSERWEQEYLRARDKFWIDVAAHDAALRAQIAADIRAAVSRDYDSEADAFFLDGTRYAARIAEGRS